MKRRNFLASLAGIPVIGKIFSETKLPSVVSLPGRSYKAGEAFEICGGETETFSSSETINFKEYSTTITITNDDFGNANAITFADKVATKYVDAEKNMQEFFDADFYGRS